MKTALKRSSLIFLILIGVMVGLIISGSFDLTSLKIAQESVTPDTPATSPAIDPQLVNQINQVFVSAANHALPSVVSIATTKIIRSSRSENNPMVDDFFREFFNLPPIPDTPRETYALGSGVIVDRDGHILTNYHVVEKADKIKVTLFNNREADAKLIGKSELFDVAILKIEEKGITPFQIGNSDKVEIGEWVMAIGSPFSERLKHTVTEGIISGKGRNPVFDGNSRLENYIQTSAPINPGNSGGALINLKGELIGINTAILSSSGGNQGIGFAIPINTAIKVLNDIVSKGYVTRAWLGVSITNLSVEMAEALKSPATKGALVQEVKEKTPASKSGIQQKDIIIGVNDQVIENSNELMNVIGSRNPGDRITLKLIRDGKERSVEVVLDEYKEEGALAESSSSPKASEADSRDLMGITVSDLTSSLRQRFGLPDNETGVIITHIDPGSAAASYGLREGDLIKEIANLPIRNTQDFQRAMSNIEREKSFLILIRRGSNSLYLAMKLPKK